MLSLSAPRLHRDRYAINERIRTMSKLAAFLWGIGIGHTIALLTLLIVLI